ncbi:hypothetical protein CHS0354_013010 [Potamilus streckersoni]|uniref:Uncharacterized protein n=1 Tax=Potamilus streckersoni TaxID=2493646 RepID=A0AAE0VF02_9BIVA|nr:hypothetical protein CHS0354_013010 [Potamilus streckersoni]
MPPSLVSSPSTLNVSKNGLKQTNPSNFTKSKMDNEGQKSKRVTTNRIRHLNVNLLLRRTPSCYQEYENYPTGSKGKRHLKEPARIKNSNPSRQAAHTQIMAQQQQNNNTKGTIPVLSNNNSKQKQIIVDVHTTPHKLARTQDAQNNNHNISRNNIRNNHCINKNLTATAPNMQLTHLENNIRTTIITDHRSDI